MKVVQGPGIGGDEGFVVDQVTEHVPVGDKGQRFLALPCGGRRQRFFQPVHHVDAVSLLIDAFGVAGPAGNDGRGAADLAALVEVDADDRQQPFGDPVGAFRAQPGQGVPDMFVGEPFDQGPLVGLEIDARDG
ncbi:MAG: hypothetical protein JWM13_1449 [Arthrobacter sp.]|nr:hypothetical protein [Arthrobacter sp.]